MLGLIMTQIKDTQFRIVTTLTVASPLSVQSARARIEKMLATFDAGRVTLVRIEAESEMGVGRLSGAPDKSEIVVLKDTGERARVLERTERCVTVELLDVDMLNPDDPDGLRELHPDDVTTEAEYGTQD